ncbi:MAG: hypothetical protein HYU27_10535, partial [Acidobacteria bacterium]|nr:hypothetical protein [Acidobacteriota bacterium]
VLQRAPGYAILRFVRALWPVYAGRLDEARDILASAPVEVLPTIAGQCCVFLRHALHGRRDAALAGFSEPLKAGAKRVEWWSWYVAECYAFVDESDEALDWLENAVRLGFINYPFLNDERVELVDGEIIKLNSGKRHVACTLRANLLFPMSFPGCGPR